MMRSAHSLFNRNRRRGTTLIEVLGTLSVLLVFGVSAASIIGTIGDLGTQSSRSRHVRAEIERMAERFRADTRQALELEISDDGSSVSLINGSTTTRYQWEETQFEMRRLVTKDEKRIELDRYQLSSRCRPVVTSTDQWVTLEITTGEQPWTIEVLKP